MREMKDSGIEWIGKIPVDWCTKKLKYCVTCLDGRRIPLDATQRQAGPYPYWGAGKIMDYIDNYIFDDRLILLGEDGAPFFDSYRPVSHLLNEKAWVNNHIHVLKTNKTMYDIYLIYCLNSVDYHEYINGAILNKLTQGNMNNIMVPTPNIVEQRAIADYLNSCCLDIDSIIVNIQSEIDTLEKYKRSVITEAVTKGLDKNVEMKDSGVKWIEKIPKGWNIIKLKYVASVVRGGSPRPINQYLSDSDDDYNWIRIGDTQKGDKYIRKTKLKIIKEGLPSTRFVKKDALLLTNSMSYGEPYILKINGCIHDGWVAFSNYKKIDKLFLYYTLLSESTRNQFAISVSGSVVVNLNIEKVKNAYIALPPLTIQRDIVEHLDSMRVAIDNLITNKQNQIGTLKKYKKSLIYEYVTGKKEVPSSWQN